MFTKRTDHSSILYLLSHPSPFHSSQFPQGRKATFFADCFVRDMCKKMQRDGKCWEILTFCEAGEGVIGKLLKSDT